MRLIAVTHAEMRSPSSEVIEVAKGYIFKYLRTKLPDLPNDVFSNSTYDSDAGDFSAERIQNDTLDIWSSRFTEPDSNVAGRTWSLELTIGKSTTGGLFGSRLVCMSRKLDFDFHPAVPIVYRELASENILFGDGVRLSAEPRDVTNESDSEWLVALINNPRRWRNVVVVAADDEGNTAINAESVARRLCGTAHVVKIFPAASFYLSDVISRHLSVFDRGVRIYRETANIEDDDVHRHPLYTHQQISRQNAFRLESTIIHDAFRTSVDQNLRKQAIPTFIQIRSASASFRLALTADNGNSWEQSQLQLDAALVAKAAAEAQSKEALDLAIQEEQTRREAEAERDQERSRAAAMSARIRSLEDRLKNSSSKKLALPEKYENFPEWIDAEFAGRIQLAPRALQGLKSGQFEDITLTCELIQLLATHYVDSKRGIEGAWDNFQSELKNRGVDFSRSISGTRAGEQGDEYFIKYRDQRTFLEWHLKKGTSRDARRDLRIYFFWDEADEEVVIGYLPGHLDNRLT
jgi:hypothetical protein